MALPTRKNVILQKYYVYDPGLHAGDELGSLRILEDADNDGALHVLAASPMMQYWLDTGLVGLKPVGEISDAQRKMLSQMTRGRSDHVDDDEEYEPTKLPKYSKQAQSGAPEFAATPASVRAKQRTAAKKNKDGGKEKKQPPKKPEPPRPAPIMGPAE